MVTTDAESQMETNVDVHINGEFREGEESSRIPSWNYVVVNDCHGANLLDHEFLWPYAQPRV